MHLPDHYLDPATSFASGAISAGAVAWSLYRLRREPRHVVMLMPAVSAGVFAAQMLNFSIAAGTSGHLLGGALAGILLGPWAGMVAMAIVVSVQAIVFGDGGIASLGANILNMAVIAAPLGAWIVRSLNVERGGVSPPKGAEFATSNGNWRPFQTRPPRYVITATIAGAVTVVAAAVVCSLELVASGAFAAGEVIPAMLAVHAWIALAEAAITAGIVAVVLALRANVGADQLAHSEMRSIAARRVFLVLTVAALVAIALAPFASNLPDGLESVAQTLAPTLSNEAKPLIPSILGDYVMPGIASVHLSICMAGLIGLAIVLATTAPFSLLARRDDAG